MQIGALEYLINAKNNVGKGISSAESDLKKFGNKISAWTIAKGQMISQVATKAVTSMTRMVKDVVGGAVNAYAEFEQLEGGIKTLFGEDTAKTIMKNANNAFMTAGMSANQYMNTVTSFSASLIQSLKGDTEAAAQVADMAIQDMADNANKMGTSMESIENAYQGFAKQNYTMLDNLKLGYGGTRSEMERLLKDAGKITGKKYDIKNLSDVYEAIHVIQGELGITGATAEEAATTVEGSMRMMKASWQNLLTAIGTGENVGDATKKFAESFKTYLNNLLPVFKRVVMNLFDALKDLLPDLFKMLSDELPGMIDLGAGLLDAVINGLKNIKWSSVKTAVKKVWKTIQDGFGKLGGLVFGTNADGSIKWPTWEDVKNAFVNAWNNIVRGAGKVMKLIFGEDADGGIKWPTLAELWAKVEPILTTLWDGIKQAAGSVLKLIFGETEDGGIDWPTPEELWARIKGDLEFLWGKIQGFAGDILKLIFGETEDGGIKWPTVDEIESKIKEGLESLWAGIQQIASDIMKLVFGEDEDGGIKWPSAEEIWGKIESGLRGLWDGIKALASGILKFIFGEDDEGGIKWPTASEIWEKVKSGLEKLWNGVKILAKGILNLTLNLFNLPDVDTIVQQIKEWWRDVVSKVKLAISVSVFGFNPDKGTTWGEQAIETNDKYGFPRLSPEQMANIDFDDEHAKGAWRVPKDNYIAKLHRDEMVLTKSQARRYRDGGGSGVDYGVIGAMIGDAVSGAMSKVYVMLNGDKVGDLTTRRIKNNINALSYSKLRAMGG